MDRRIYDPALVLYVDFRRSGDGKTTERSVNGITIENHSGLCGSEGMYFDSTGDGVEIHITSQALLGDNVEFTVMMIGKTIDDLQVQTFFGSSPVFEREFWMVNNVGNVEFAHTSQFEQVPLAQQMTGKFMQMTFTWRMGRMYGLIDDLRKISGLFTGNGLLDNTLNIHVGVKNKNTGIQDRLEGVVGTIIIWKRPLEEVEVNRIRHIIGRRH